MGIDYVLSIPARPGQHCPRLSLTKQSTPGWGLPDGLRSAFFCFFLLVICPRIGIAADFWPEFRGPGAQGISTATNVPVTWSATSNIAWKVAVPGKGWSSPVLADGKIYLSTACEIEGSSDFSLRVVCLSAADGRTLWNVEAIHPDPSALRAIHMKNSLASPTPIIHGDRLFAHFGHMGTACLALDGKVLWRQQGVKYSPMHGNGGSPVWVDSELVFSCDGLDNPFVVALDAKTGQVKWKTPRDTPAKKKFSFCTPLVVDRGTSKQVISAGSGFVAGYDPAGGRELWRFRYGNGYSVVPRPVLSGDLLFISSGFDFPILYAIRLDGAGGDITTNNAAWSYAKQVPTTPSMLVVGRELYFVSDGGIASCLDAQTGAVHWSERLEGGFSASPIYADGRIYFQNEAGAGFVIKAGTRFELVSTNDLEERSLASYAVADNELFIRTVDHLWAIKN
jgi:outer membrane protein assembly factor BamB